MSRFDTDRDERIIQLKRDLAAFKSYYVDGWWGTVFFWKRNKLAQWVQMVSQVLNNADEPKLTAEEILQFARAADGARGFSWWSSQFRTHVRQYCPNPYTRNRATTPDNTEQAQLGELAKHWSFALRNLPRFASKAYTKRLVKRMSYLEIARSRVELFILALSKWNNSLGAHLPDVAKSVHEHRAHRFLIKQKPNSRQKSDREAPNSPVSKSTPPTQAVKQDASQEDIDSKLNERPVDYLSETDAIIRVLKSNKSCLKTDFNIMGSEAEHNWYLLVSGLEVVKDSLRVVKGVAEEIQAGRLTHGLKRNPLFEEEKDGKINAELLKKDHIDCNKFCAEEREKFASGFKSESSVEERELYIHLELTHLYVETMIDKRYEKHGKTGLAIASPDAYEVVMLELLYVKLSEMILKIQEISTYIDDHNTTEANPAQFIKELKLSCDWVISLSLYAQYLGDQKKLYSKVGKKVTTKDFSDWYDDKKRDAFITTAGTNGVLRTSITIRNLLREVDSFKNDKSKTIFSLLEKTVNQLSSARETRSEEIKKFRNLFSHAPESIQTDMGRKVHQELSDDPDTLIELGAAEKKSDSSDYIPQEWSWMQRLIDIVPIDHIIKDQRFNSAQTDALLRLRIGLRPAVSTEKKMRLRNEVKRKPAEKGGQSVTSTEEEQIAKGRELYEQTLLRNYLGTLLLGEISKDPNWFSNAKIDSSILCAIATCIVDKYSEKENEAPKIKEIRQVLGNIRRTFEKNRAPLNAAIKHISEILSSRDTTTVKLILGDLFVKKINEKHEEALVPNAKKYSSNMAWINALLFRLTEVSQYKFERDLREQASLWHDAIIEAILQIRADGESDTVFKVIEKAGGIKSISLALHDADLQQLTVLLSESAGHLSGGFFIPCTDEDLMLERNEAIEEVSDELKNIKEISSDLRDLVLSQEDDIRIITSNMNNSSKQTQEGVNHIKKALGVIDENEDSGCKESRQTLKNCSNAGVLLSSTEGRSLSAKGAPNNNPDSPKSIVDFSPFSGIFSFFSGGNKNISTKPVSESPTVNPSLRKA